MDARRGISLLAALSITGAMTVPAFAQQDVDPAAEENPALVTPRTRSTLSELDAPRPSHPALAALSVALEGQGASFAGLRPGRADRAHVCGLLGAPVRWTDTLEAWVDTEACVEYRLHSIGASYADGKLHALILKFGEPSALAEVQATLGIGTADRVEPQENGHRLLAYPYVGVDLVVVDETRVAEIHLLAPVSSESGSSLDTPKDAELRPTTALWIRSARPVHTLEYHAQGMAVFACDLRAMGLNGQTLDYRSHATAPDGSELWLLAGAPDAINDGSGRFGRSIEVLVNADDWLPKTVGTSIPLGQVALPTGLGAFVVRRVSLTGADLQACAFVREDLPPVGPCRAIGIESVAVRGTADGLRVDIEVTGSSLKGEDVSILAGLIGPDKKYLRAAPGVETALKSPDRRLILADKLPMPDDEATLRTTLWFQPESLLDRPAGPTTLQVAANLASAGVLGEWRYADLFADAMPGGAAGEESLSPVQRLVADAALAFAGALRSGDPRAAAGWATGKLADALSAEAPLGRPGQDPAPGGADLRLRSVDVLLDSAAASVSLVHSADPSGSSDFRLDMKLIRQADVWKVTTIQALEPDPHRIVKR